MSVYSRFIFFMGQVSWRLFLLGVTS